MLCRIICSIGFLILSTLPLLSQGNKISGVLTDEDSNMPVPYVTVYLNGTTTGTTTNENGYFELNAISLPCELILSHVSYHVQRIQLDEKSRLSDLKIRLEKRILSIEELTVIGENERDKYLHAFKVWLLGEEHFSLGCDILNDSVIRFIPNSGSQFEAYATQPLEVSLPEIGYRLNIDLIHFTLLVNEQVGGYHCSILGYFFFEELSFKSRREQRSIARNRVRAYYNSRLHFCRSLYKNRLAENGFIMENAYYKEEVKHDFKYWYSNEDTNNGILHLCNFPTPYYNVNYYSSWRNIPADLNHMDPHPSNLSASRLYFAKDTVRIYPSGRVAENTLLFNGAIGDKRVMWMLPFDYIPSMQ